MKTSHFNIIIGVLLFHAFTCQAQYRASYESVHPRMNISQIDKREFSTLLFFDYTTPNDSTWFENSRWMNFGDKTYISVPGSNKKYRMLSTVNMPVSSEAEQKMMLFDGPGQRHQFVLEFEKLPDDCYSFDLIEDLDNPTAFNFSNVTINPTDSLPFVNVDEFIEDYPVKEYGSYYVNGTVVTYVKYNGITVNAVPVYLDQYGKYFSINISVQNFRDRSILFNPHNITAQGVKHPKKKIKNQKEKFDYEGPIYSVKRKKKGESYNPDEYDLTISNPVKVEVLSYEEYDKIIREKQQWQSFWAALGEGLAAAGAGYSSSSTSYYGNSYTNANAHAYGNVGDTYGYVNAYGSSYTTAYGQSYTTSYNGLAAYAASQHASAKMANLRYAQREIRQQIGDGYVKKHTIPAETEYSGFFNIKYVKGLHNLHFTITIDGEPYTFYF